MPSAKQLRKAVSANKGQQYAALPVIINGSGQLEVLLLTSRGSRRWVLPKGWPIRKLAPGAAAAREAYEEAGVEGQVRPRTSIGAYHYAKNLEVGQLPMTVKVFLLWVERQLPTWPEQAERETRWFSPEVAAGLVAEPELAALILRAPEVVARKKR